MSIFKKTENNQIVNADTAPFGVSIIAPNMVNNPFNFWCTLITTGQEWYTQQLALPWSYADKSLKYRVKDSGVWSEWIEFIPNPDIKYFKELKLIKDPVFINTTPTFIYHGYINGWDMNIDKSMLPTREGTWWDIQYYPAIYYDNDNQLSDNQAKMIAINSNSDLYIRTHQESGWSNWKLK